MTHTTIEQLSMVRIQVVLLARLAPIAAALRAEGLKAKLTADPWVRIRVDHGGRDHTVVLMKGNSLTLNPLEWERTVRVELADPQAFDKITNAIRTWSACQD